MNTKNIVSSTPSKSLREGASRPLTSPKRNARNYSARQAILGVAALCGPLLATSGTAADPSASTSAAPAASPGLQKPAWLTDLSFGVRESYDNNVFFSGVDRSVLKTYPVAAGYVAALKNVDSALTTVSPKVGVNFAPLLGDQTIFKALSLGYAPDFVTYGNASSENYNAHRVAAAIKGQADAFSFNLENGFNYINGNKFGAVFPGSYDSAYATAALRERREQYQDRAGVTLQYDQEKWFVRPTASMLYYDLKTAQLAGVTGYQNYADRYDLNGGVDLGYKVNSDVAVTLGYRYGHQYQQKYAYAIDNYGFSSSSDYQRVLLGLEGKPLSWLTAKVQGGPDFRSYADSAPVVDRHPMKYYGEASLTAAVTPNDSFTFKYRQFQWVSSTGKVPYFDSTYDLAYTRKVTSDLSFSLAARALSSDYTSGETTATGSTPKAPKLTTNARDDWQYTVGAGVRYSFTPNFGADLTYSYDLGRNQQDGLGSTAKGTDISTGNTRNFDHHLVSLGVSLKF